MHDIMVESLFPEKRVQEKKVDLDEEVKKAMKKAAERVKEFGKRKHRKSVSVLLGHRKTASVLGEVRDAIYFS
jgi:histidinol dehydrogenase